MCWCPRSHLLRATVDDLWLVADGRAQPFDGDLDDYRDWLARQRSEAAAPDAQQVADRAQRREERAQAQADRQARLAERRPLVKEIEKLERSLAGWQGEKHCWIALADRPVQQRGRDWGAHPPSGVGGVDDAEVRWLEVQGLEEWANRLIPSVGWKSARFHIGPLRQSDNLSGLSPAEQAMQRR